MKKSRLFGVLFTLVITQCLVGSQALASLLIVSGDSNIGNPIDGSSTATVNPDNTLWFDNILGSSTSVKVLNDIAGIGGSIDTSAVSISNHYDSLVGIASTLASAGSTIDDTFLTGIDLFINMMPSDDFTLSELNSMSSFLSGGGTLFFMGENSNSTDYNARINSALSFLGSGMSIVDAFIDSGFNTTVLLDADPLNTGVNDFTYATTSVVSGGTSLIRTLTGNNTFIAYENVSSIPQPAAIWLFGSGLLGLIGIARRKAA